MITNQKNQFSKYIFKGYNMYKKYCKNKIYLWHVINQQQTLFTHGVQLDNE